jgi:hypothetical protein
MSKYELWNLILVAIYDLLTFLLVLFVVYEAIIKPKLSDIACFFIRLPPDTKSWSWIRQVMDFVLENRGPELKNIKISSHPDDLGWGNLGPESAEGYPRRTSEIFRNVIPFLAKNERHQFFWCDVEKNSDIVETPIEIIIEYDNPIFFYPKRCKKVFKFDFAVFDGVIWGVIKKYDIHNVAIEIKRIREKIEEMAKLYKK